MALRLLEPGGALKGRLFPALVGASCDTPLAPGTVVGRYRVTGELGRGGCGVVYRAERCDGVFAHAVALKLGRPRKRELVQRERESLSRLEHPGIARIIDGGETDDGHSWLAMELVDGEPVDRWCERTRPSWRRRAELLVDICSVVHYAHGKLVVHRDLKPANIFVDAAGKPRLLDFGVALLLDAERDTAAVGMSPGYCSPEQCAGESTDTATDVYSLGVIAAELLSPDDRLARANLAAIVRRATSTDRARRYDSVAALSADLVRLLDCRPVPARQWSPPAHALFFARRRRLPLVVTALVASVLAAVAVVSTQRITREHDVAMREAQTTREVSTFLIELFEGARTDAGTGNSVLEMLERGRRLAEQDGEAAPATTGALLQALGAAYAKLGRLADAQALVSQAVTLRRRSDAAGGLRLAESLTELSRLRYFLGDSRGSYAAADEAQALLARDRSASVQQRYHALVGLADAYDRTGRYAEAEPVVNEAMDAAIRAFGRHSREHVHAMRVRAHWLADRQQESAALPDARFVVERLAATAGGDDPAVVFEQIFFAHLQAANGNPREAERYFRALYARNASLAGDVAWRRHAARYHLGFALEYQGRYDEAATAFEQSLDDVPAVEGHAFGPHRAADSVHLADLYRRQGDAVRAEALLRRAMDVVTKTFPADGPVVVGAQTLLAQLLTQRGDLDEAQSLLQRTVPASVRIFGDASYAAARAHAALGEVRRRRGDAHGALAAFAAARRMTASGSYFEQAELLADVAWSQAQLAAAQGDIGRAVEIQAASVEATAGAVGADHPLAAAAGLRLAVLRDLAALVATKPTLLR
ncbi:serine/threonine-protein kinase [Tahibacter soli]|uniref:Tetratricopeptide repeat protein n=1 Tax=Tahibacter soli TaxID=2983605 RepID=A0A9X4BJB5_9GAMM|nr:serine/threonine-protein kinase [Tahibacter soli]MDC8016170.1 tetratricopeptide repeat protein [Tahibacter soli]